MFELIQKVNQKTSLPWPISENFKIFYVQIEKLRFSLISRKDLNTRCVDLKLM